MIEIEIQNETHQNQVRLKFLAVPRIGEGIRLQAPDGEWASYDVLDLWYQRAEYGDVWVPFIHVRLTPPGDDFGAVLRPDFSQLKTQRAELEEDPEDEPEEEEVY